MSEKQHLIIDCDGVLLDPIYGFIKWALFNFPSINIGKVLRNNTNFIDECIIAYWHSSNFSKLPMLKSAKYPIEYLKNKYDIDVVTNCGNESNIRNARVENLENLFGKGTFKNIYTLSFKASKKEVYDIYDNALVVDDELPNIIEAEKSARGHKTFWMNYYPLFKALAYNKYDKSLEKKFEKKNWKDIISYTMDNNLTK